ncbi:Emopamil binding protein-domain-containing protein [Apiosordaria backusii]|uniref:Emopamil binding protein-domain-containing protein n=1 Tax=Apiosordaria backusii TaxID=314023 RepID=A0AA40BSW5_9PEZI|nr:Emopamil binding protein-domain-containing protein [Apiosordaria backusii]
MASSTASPSGGNEPLTFLEMIDQTTIISLLSTLAILFAALGLSKLVLDKSTPGRLRFLFVWHAFDALIHFILEGSFVYHCLFSSTSVREVKGDYFPTPYYYLGEDQKGRVWGSQAAAAAAGAGAGAGAAGKGGNFVLGALAELWMVYAKADRRWAGVDLATLSIEIITVVFGGLMAGLVCWDLARGNVARGNLAMIILATAELYGGYMTFMPEWLSGSLNLDTSNFMYKWIFLVFFNGLWVVIPLYAIYVAGSDIYDAIWVRSIVEEQKKGECVAVVVRAEPESRGRLRKAELIGPSLFISRTIYIKINKNYFIIKIIIILRNITIIKFIKAFILIKNNKDKSKDNEGNNNKTLILFSNKNNLSSIFRLFNCLTLVRFSYIII